MTVLRCLLIKLLLCKARYIRHIHMVQHTSCKILENPCDSVGVRESVLPGLLMEIWVAASSPDIVVAVSSMEPTRCLGLLAKVLS